MTSHRTYVLAITFAVVALVILMPQPAHAVSPLGVLGSAFGFQLEFVYELLDLLHGLILKAIATIGDLIQPVANLKLSSGGPTVYTIWRVLRDFCNMAFIVALILMSFGTIFDSLNIGFLKPYSINAGGVIPGFLMAAILLNFSLAIGQTVIETSNEVTGIVLKMMPENFGAALAQSLKLASTNLNSFATQPQKNIAVVDNVATEGLSPSQQTGLSTLASPAAKQAFTNCVKNKQDQPRGCYTRFVLPSVIAASAKAEALAKSKPQYFDGWTFSPSTAIGCLIGECKLRGAAAAGPQSSSTLFRMITEKIYLILLSTILMISFVVVLLFLLVRIPALWILLALSPLAWTSLAFPGMRKGGYDLWWKQFWGWNLFSPMYLFMLYFGMLFIQNISPAVSSLANQDGSVPLVAGFIGNAFGYFMAGVVLIGGSAAVFKASGIAGTAAGAWAGRITGFLGAGGELGALAPALRLTGLRALGETLRATAVARGEKIAQVGKPLVPKPFRVEPYEDKLARLRAQMGVTGAAKEYVKVVGKRGKEIEEPHKARLQELENRRAQAKTDEERTTLDATIKKLKDTHVEMLRRQQSSRDRDTRLAAGDLLMAQGKLNAEQLQALGEQYRQVGREALAGFIERRDKKLVEDAPKQKLEKGKEAEQVASFLALFADPKKANEYLTGLQKGKNKFWALEAGTSRKIIMGPDGKTPLDLEQAVEREGPKFTASDWVNAESHYHKYGKPMSKRTEIYYQQSLLDTSRSSQMFMEAAADPAQIERIEQAQRNVRDEVSKLQTELRELNAQAKDFINQARTAQEAGNAAEAQSYRTRAQVSQKDIDIAQTRLNELRQKPKEEPVREEKKAEPKKEEKEEGKGKEEKK